MNFRVILFVAVAGIALIALFDRLRPEGPAAAVPETTPPLATQDHAPVSASPGAQERPDKVYAFRFSDGQRAEGPSVIRSRQGERITLRVASDRTQTLHLHGYDRELDLRPDETLEMPLELIHSGRFELELHDPHAQVGIIEVQPR